MQCCSAMFNNTHPKPSCGALHDTTSFCFRQMKWHSATWIPEPKATWVQHVKQCQNHRTRHFDSRVHTLYINIFFTNSRSPPAGPILPYTLLGGAPHPPDPPGLKIHEKLNFQKIPRPNFEKLNFQKISRPFFFNPGGVRGVRCGAPPRELFKIFF